MGLITTVADLAEIGDLGSNYANAKVVAGTSGADLSPVDTFETLPIRQNFDLANAISENTTETEGGDEIITSTKEKWTLKYITKQISKATINDLPAAINGKYLLIVLELNSTPINGKHLYAGVIAKIVGSGRPSLKKQGELEYSFQLYKATTEITINLTGDAVANFSGTFSSSTIVIPVGEYIGITAVNA